MAKTLVNLTLGESKTKVDLTKEAKATGKTWDEATETWDEADYIWDNPKLVSTREAKTKVDLNLE